jgi:hypothetical protein
MHIDNSGIKKATVKTYKVKEAGKDARPTVMTMRIRQKPQTATKRGTLRWAILSNGSKIAAIIKDTVAM